MISGGEMVNHYKIIRSLGKGGMGEVFLAEDTVLERQVAIKFLPEEVFQDPGRRKRFLREAKAAAGLDHPNICQVYETNEAEGRSFIVMEYVAGETLAQRLDRGRMPLLETIQMACEIAEALGEAHEKGIVHRDLKPANIMLKVQGRPKIMDFGLAKRFDPASGQDAESQDTAAPDQPLQPLNLRDADTVIGSSASTPPPVPRKSSSLISTLPPEKRGLPDEGETLSISAELTQAGTLVGTLDYMSPEQASGRPLDGRSDIFAFGVVLYEMLSGKNPFRRESHIQTLSAIIKDAAPAPQVEGARSVPAALRDILNKALAKNISERYQSIKEMEQDLREVRDDLMPRKRPAWVNWALSGAAVLVVALGVLAIWFANREVAPIEHEPLPILIADFENSTGETVFNDVLEQALHVGLEEAPFITSYQRGRAKQIAQEIQPGSSGLNKEEAQLVAQREGISLIITGSIAKAGSEYRITAEAMDSISGEITSERSIRAKGRDDVLPKMAELALKMREDLGDTEAGSTEIMAQETFTSSSLEAAQIYVKAQDLQNVGGKWSEAIDAYLNAVKLDPDFGRAYAGIAACYLNLVQPEEADRYFGEAMKRIDRMTPREKYRTIGSYYIKKKQYRMAIDQYEALVENYPADKVGLNNLALAYFYAREMANAMEIGRKSLEMEPSNIVRRSNLALFALYASEFDTATTEASEAIQQDPTYKPPYTCLALAEIINGRPLQARQLYDKLSEADNGASLAAMGLADLALYEGKLQEPVSLLEEGIKNDLAQNSNYTASVKMAALADAYLLLGEEEKACSTVEKAVAASQEDRILFEAASVYLEAGRTAEANKLAEILDSRLEADPQAYAHIIQARVFSIKGEWANALDLLTSAMEALDCWLIRFELGKIYLASDRIAAAYDHFDQCLNRRGEATALFLDDIPTMRYLPPLYYYLGRAQEGLGSPRATESYNTFLTIKADSDDDPLVADARERVERFK